MNTSQNVIFLLLCVSVLLSEIKANFWKKKKMLRFYEAILMQINDAVYSV